MLNGFDGVVWRAGHNGESGRHVTQRLVVIRVTALWRCRIHGQRKSRTRCQCDWVIRVPVTLTVAKHITEVLMQCAA